jgi:DNA gyrase subunit A
MAETIQKKLIEDEMKSNYMDYAMSVIVSRALPDVRDGLKPVHRRVLYAMHHLGLQHNKAFKKSANVVGTCMAKWHPHGDVAIYDTLVRMAQDFSLRYPLVDGQGNFGSIDQDAPAAQRYTECRMKKLSEEMLSDIEKDTVDFVPNYDGSEKEPTVLPSKIPNLLINGSSGIAVGMATNMAPHNIKEVCDAVTTFIDNPNITISEIMKLMPGPDFPTGGYICGRKGILDAYTTGRGRLVLRAKTEIEEKADKKRIIVYEIPYQVNKSLMIENIADLIRDKRIEGISDIRDESDRQGIRVVFDLKKGFDESVVLNQLYHISQLQTTFGIINIALVDGQPRTLGLKDLIMYYVNHRKEVVTRRTKFDLLKAEEKAHILEGLRIALQQIDPVIKTIKSSKDGSEAKARLISGFKLTDKQAQAILDMKLQRLTSLEQEGINSDYENTISLMQKLRDILSSESKIFGIIKKELEELKNSFSDDRKTEILEEEEEIGIEDMIPEEDVAVTVTHSGYIKKLPMQTYKQQKRGGKGVRTTELKEEDDVEHVFTTSNHNYILFFTNKGKVHWLKAYNIPTASRYSKGKAIINLMSIDKDERITTLIPVSEFDEKHFLLMATKRGLVKKTRIVEYSNPRKGGIAAIKLREGDELVKVLLTPGILNIVIATKKGIAVKFNEQDVLVIGRTGMGVKGIRLKGKDEVVGMEVALEAGALLTVTENGYGKRTEMGEYTLIKRGGSGVINIKTSERNGDVVGIKTVKEGDEILVVTKKGQMIRVPVKDISVIGRATQGVRIMKLDEGDKITTITRVIAKIEE